MKNLILTLLFLTGCSSQLKIEDQNHFDLNVEKVFLNDENSITIIYKNEENTFVPKKLRSEKQVEFLYSDNKHITFNIYLKNKKMDNISYVYDLKVYLPFKDNKNLFDELEAGEEDKGKFGKYKLKTIE
jgi:transcriptional regulator NrdR family protein